MSRVAKVFELNPGALRIRRALFVVVALGIPYIFLAVLGLQIYIFSVLFAILYVGMGDPGGAYRTRFLTMGAYALIGAALTLWGFGIASWWWGWIVASGFVVTLLGGLALKFGLQRYSIIFLLNTQFFVALSLGYSYGSKAHAWSQALAWLIASAVWIALTCLAWLVRGRPRMPHVIPEFTADTAVIKLTRPAIFFAIIRAVAVSIGVAISFGLHVPDADWMPIATMIAMKGRLDQSTLVGMQRFAGALIGALVAIGFLLTVSNKYVLVAVVIIFFVIGGAIRWVNFAFYTAAISAGVLIAMDASHPSNLSAEGRRVFFTLVGVAIALLVLLLSNLLQRRRPAASGTVKPATA
jgi:hypothetical protein